MRKVTPTKRMSGDKHQRTNDTGRKVLVAAQDFKNDAIGRWRLRTRRGSSIRVGSPTRRLIYRNGECIEEVTALGRSMES